jgi:hypothetical protein
MDKKYFIALFCALVVNIIPVLGQDGCGTVFSAGQKTLENSVVITEGKPTESLPQINRTLSIAVFVVKSQGNIAGITDANIQNAINTLSLYFNPIALKFTMCSVTYIDNYQLNTELSHAHISNSKIALGDHEKDLLTLYNIPNTINLYVVNKNAITDSSNRTVGGFTYMPGDAGKNSIFITKFSILDGSTLAHQMGHFLNLYHTSEVRFGAEAIDESNCKTAGDRCCDTDADPDLSSGTLVDANCIYIGSNIGPELYHPSAKNMMSLGPVNCRCVFSRTQFLRMIDALTRLRANLH